MNVNIIDGRYTRLANKRAIIEGRCARCGANLIKAKIMARNNVFTMKSKENRRRL